MPRWHILVVDDEEVIAEQTAELLRSAPGLDMEVHFETSFQQSLVLLEQQHYDLLVLDVRDQALAVDSQSAPDGTETDATEADTGLQIFEEVRKRRFVPIVFYTALPGLVEGMKRPPFIDSVDKNHHESITTLREMVRRVLDSPLTAINRGILDHVGEIIRDFMANFVEPHWNDLTSSPRQGDLAYLLLRRLAFSLTADGEGFARRLAADAGVDLALDTVHPMRLYIMPPIGSWTTGDIISGPIIRPTVQLNERNSVAAVTDQEGSILTVEPGEADPSAPESGQLQSRSDSGQNIEKTWYVILTPACDLVPDRVKADNVLLVECMLLKETAEFKEWVGSPPVAVPSKSVNDKLREFLRNRAKTRQEGRNIYLPAAWLIPDLVIDFQRTTFLPYREIGLYKREATLDSPYVEWLISKYGRYLGRLGTPDLDVDAAMRRLTEA